MNKHFFLIVSFMIVFQALHGQSSKLIVNSYISIPKDSMENMRLVSSLNGLLDATYGPHEDNKWILPSQRMETNILLDEFINIQKSKKYSNDTFYLPYLTNLVSLSEDRYLIQLSYIGVSNEIPMLRASFELIAYKTDNKYLFSSTLSRNTKDWKIIKTEKGIFHYPTTINSKNVELYNKNATLFDKKLGSTNKVVEFYCTNSMVELLQLIGVSYKLDYNGKQNSVFSTTLNDKKLIVFGNKNKHFDKFDLHDLWHDRLSLVISRRKVNKPIDEACAYLYGGSWGYSWTEILEKFLDKYKNDKSVDWIAIKENNINFGESKAKHLMTDYVVNALIVQKLEKEQGFSAVWDMLNCGPFEKGNDKYYTTLEKLTGVSKKNYNSYIKSLIEKENKSYRR